jgi:soluble lytic murein transglycosylase-like protein
MQAVIDPANSAAFPPTVPNSVPFGPELEMMVTKSMLYSAAIKHGVNPYLVMGLAWHESGWNASAISSAGAVGIMQVMPATAAASGPALLHRKVNLYDPADNIDMGTAIIRSNLDRWGNDLAKALVAYYAGGGAVREWNHLSHDEQRYVWAVYHAAIMFKEGKGPV